MPRVSDKAVVGYCRIGHFRVGVRDPYFDDIIHRLTAPSSYVEPITPPADLPYGEWDNTDWDNCLWE